MLDIPKETQKRFIDLKEEIDAMVYKAYKAKVLVWLDGIYGGRQCVVRHVSWDIDWRNPSKLEIQVVVDTKKLKAAGYLEYPKHDRCYMNVHEYFKEST